MWGGHTAIIEPGLHAVKHFAQQTVVESYRGNGRLQGYGAIITGADSGIGRAVALAFAREGADVLISYLSEDSDAQETARIVERAGRKAVMVRGDVGREGHWAATTVRPTRIRAGPRGVPARPLPR